MENKDNQKLETLRQHDKTSYDAVLWLKDNKQKFKAIVYEPIMTQVNNLHYCKLRFYAVTQQNWRPNQHLPACSKLTIEALEQGVKYVQSSQSRQQNDAKDQWHSSGVLIVNFEHISHLDLEFLLLIWNM